MDVRLALAQTAVTGDKAANLDVVRTATKSAARAGARLIVFPEASMFHFGKPNESLGPAGEPLDGPFVRALRDLARAHRMWILAGMFETIAADPGRVHNTLVLADERGELAGIYRKVHLYDAFGYAESARIVAGDGATLSFAIDGMRFGAFTCYDLRFPEIARALVQAGAQTLLLPAAWLDGVLKELHFTTLLRARAIENTAYVCAADQCGRGYSGNSHVIDPLGIVVRSAGEAPDLLVADLSAERLHAAREKNPSLGHARRDVYERWSQESLRPV